MLEYFGILSPTKSQHFFVCLFGEHMYGQNLHIMIYTHSSVISIIIIPSIFVLMLGKGTWQNENHFTFTIHPFGNRDYVPGLHLGRGTCAGPQCCCLAQRGQILTNWKKSNNFSNEIKDHS